MDFFKRNKNKLLVAGAVLSLTSLAIWLSKKTDVAELEEEK